MRRIWSRLPGLRTKRFSFRLFVAFATLTVIVSSLLLWGIYFSARGDLMESERRLSTELLTQVRYNLVSLDEMNRTLCFSVLHSNEAQSLLYNTKPDDYQLMLQRNRLANSLSNNPFVHSVYLYNAVLDTFYSTFRSFHYVDSDFLAQLDSGALTSGLKPLVRELDGDVVLTYGLSELYGGDAHSETVYVNIHLDYLIDNLEVFTGGQLLAFDESGSLISRFTDRIHVTDDLLAALVRAMPSSVSSEQADMVRLESASMPSQSATMLHCPQLDWTLVKLSPYHEVFSRTERLRTTILLFCAGSIGMNLLLCYLLARRMYRPIQHVIDQVAVDSPGAVFEDEFAYLSRFYMEMRGELAELKQQRQNLMQQSDLALQKLLFQSHLMDQEERAGLMREYEIGVDIDRPTQLLVFIADDYTQLPTEFAQESERPLLLFALRNLLEEAFAKVPRFALSCPEDRYLTMLMNADSMGKADLTALIKSFQSAALSYFNLPVAVAVSGRIDDPGKIAEAYANMRGLLAERFIHGKDFITYEDERAPVPPASGLEIAESLRRLNAFIEKGDSDSAIREAETYFGFLAQMDTVGAISQIIRLQLSIHGALLALNSSRADPVDFSGIMRDAASIQSRTLQEYRAQVLHVLREIKQEVAAKSRTETLAESIVAIIEHDYANPMLCAGTIAEQLNVSSAYVGRVFGQHTGFSIPEYINQIRLEKAALWLTNSDLTVGDIMLRIGYTNESYFFKLFKLRYGVTPRNYAGEGSK